MPEGLGVADVCCFASVTSPLDGLPRAHTQNADDVAAAAVAACSLPTIYRRMAFPGKTTLANITDGDQAF